MAVLISFAGLPGTGKSTIAQALSIATGAVYLRIDEIDAAIWNLDPDRDIGPESYHIAAALAASNLQLGHTTIIDCVNPWDITRQIFFDAATRAGARLLGVETHCSDLAMHQMRVEDREMDVPGLNKPGWQQVLARDYTPWATADLKLDTTALSVVDAVSEIEKRL
ncbi:AAA family ATPase [Cohaesibacter haloalkalitolerans]|uniref:AAA family ATPase n=1 Tax=Cohaesibacter haloalkalitolerans TaxID=1162980 RepID=UPI000E653538|nr:AAA family ATPase [Cohaesibacter haloalkalitolerans]